MNGGEGRCLCGAVTWQFKGQETWACYCHCDDCRRNCAAPVVAFIGVQKSAFAWTGAQPNAYISSPNVTRHFCGTCGTPMAFDATHYDGEIHLYAASLTTPESFEPAFHVHTEEHLSWLKLEDGLPRHEKSYEP